MTDPARAERAAVVAWLLGEARCAPAPLEFYAAAIERGEHLAKEREA